MYISQLILFCSFIFVPNSWNLLQLHPLLLKCFIQNVTDIVFSGFPTGSDYHGMKFILDALTQGCITNIVLKFPSYCLMSILSPVLICPRSFSLSYLSSKKQTNSKNNFDKFDQNFNLFVINRFVFFILIVSICSLAYQLLGLK